MPGDESGTPPVLNYSVEGQLTQNSSANRLQTAWLDRVVERKKFGKAKARRSFQFSKR